MKRALLRTRGILDRNKNPVATESGCSASTPHRASCRAVGILATEKTRAARDVVCPRAEVPTVHSRPSQR